MKADLKGKKFGRLIVVEYVGEDKSRHAMWKCHCECGTEIVTAAYRLKNGTCKSCGCYREEKLNIVRNKHNMSHSRLYRAWGKMNYRGKSKTWYNAHRYAERGISVCKEWAVSFETFADWAVKNGYDDNLSLDRIDNNKGYSPDNCRWVDRTSQQRNREVTLVYEYKGELKPLAEWTEIIGMKYKTLYDRVKKRGWSIEKALEMPLQKK